MPCLIKAQLLGGYEQSISAEARRRRAPLFLPLSLSHSFPLSFSYRSLREMIEKLEFPSAAVSCKCTQTAETALRCCWPWHGPEDVAPYCIVCVVCQHNQVWISRSAVVCVSRCQLVFLTAAQSFCAVGGLRIVDVDDCLREELDFCSFCVHKKDESHMCWVT